MNDKEQIIHVSSVHNYNDGRIFEKQCRSLSKKYNVSIYNSNYDGKIDNIIFKKLNFIKNNKILRILTSWLIVLPRTCFGKHKIIHFHDPELIFASPFWKLFGKKVIYDVHENYSKQIIAHENLPFIVRLILSKIILLIEVFFSFFIDLVIVVLDDLNPTLNFFNKRAVVGNQPIIDYNFSFKKRKNQVCYFGIITEKRGILKAVKILEKEKIKLVLGGKFESEEFKKRILNYDNVEYLGFVERKKIIEVVSESKCGICTLLPTLNHINGSPTKLFEYLAYGTPAVASNFKKYIQQVPEKNKFIYYVDPTNSNEIAETLKKIIKMDNKQINEIGLSAHQFSKKNIDWKKEEEEELFRAYNNII